LNYNDEPRLYVAAFSDDEKKIFINGKWISEPSNSQTFIEVDASRYLKIGVNTVEIAYELFGAPNFGPKLGELKGIDFVRVGDNSQTGSSVETWEIQTFSAAARGREVNSDFAFGQWKNASLNDAYVGEELAPAFTWCREEFSLPQVPEEWFVPWKLVFDSSRDALIYLNGRFVGRYSTSGPQNAFFLPDPYFKPANQKNVLTLVAAYTRQASVIHTVRIEPYREYSVWRTRVEFEW
jgi:Beta-galactosidase second all-beta domain